MYEQLVIDNNSVTPIENIRALQQEQAYTDSILPPEYDFRHILYPTVDRIHTHVSWHRLCVIGADYWLQNFEGNLTISTQSLKINSSAQEQTILHCTGSLSFLTKWQHFAWCSASCGKSAEMQQSQELAGITYHTSSFGTI